MMMRCSKEEHDLLFRTYKHRTFFLEEIKLFDKNYRERYPVISNIWKDVKNSKPVYRYDHTTGYWRRVS